MASMGILRATIPSGKRLLKQTPPQARGVITNPTGGFLEAPERKGFRGILGITMTVIAGLTIGSVISRDMAGFLEENDLFVPSEDDDDD